MSEFSFVCSVSITYYFFIGGLGKVLVKLTDGLNNSGVNKQITWSASFFNSVMVEGGPTGIALTVVLAPLLRTEANAAFIVEPVAMPSSTMMTSRFFKLG
jgi:hypothetical protein